jgi:hypothetical protein
MADLISVGENGGTGDVIDVKYKALRCEIVRVENGSQGVFIYVTWWCGAVQYSVATICAIVQGSRECACVQCVSTRQ